MFSTALTLAQRRTAFAPFDRMKRIGLGLLAAGATFAPDRGGAAPPDPPDPIPIHESLIRPWATLPEPLPADEIPADSGEPDASSGHLFTRPKATHSARPPLSPFIRNRSGRSRRWPFR